MPLALVIARYFVYVVAAFGAVWLVAFTGFSMSMNAGAVYSANYGPSHADETAATLRALPAFDPAAVPTAYRYVRFDEAGAVLSTDLPDDDVAAAWDAARSWLDAAGGEASSGAPAAVTGSGGTTYAAFGLPDGTLCVLTCQYLPQFVARDLRDALPNPQNIFLGAGGVASVLAALLVARRASRVIMRKMAPLTDAADRIAREELDFAVGQSNVREVNDVLAAMERMRAALQESLAARWRAEQAQRDQVAALAHDLKTPLTVVRANAEFVAEELRGLDPGADAAGGKGGRFGGAEAPAGPWEDVVAAAEDAVRGGERLDAYVRLLVEVACGAAEVGRRVPVGVRAFAGDAAREAAALARAAGKALTVEGAEGLPDGACVKADAGALGRAVGNAVANALDYARDGVRLAFSVEAARGPGGGPAEGGRFRIAVEDDGPGFSPAALEHGCERFFRDDAARGGSVAGEAHHGIGLAVASEVARAHGGSLALENRVDPATGAVLGARVVLEVPLAG